MELLNVFKIVGYIALIFGAICTVCIDFLKDKADKKKEEEYNGQMIELTKEVKESRKLLEPFNNLASNLFPSLTQEDALNRLKNRLDSLDQDMIKGNERMLSISDAFTTEKRTIKTFEAVINIHFKGKWKSQPYPQSLSWTNSHTYFRWEDFNNKLPIIEFTATQINYETLSAEAGVFKAILKVGPNNFPLGKQIDILNEFETASFMLVFTNPEEFISPILTITKTDIAILINGSKVGSTQEEYDIEINMSQVAEFPFPKGKDFTPVISFKDRPIKTFGINL